MTLYGFDAAYQPNLAAVKAAGGIAVNGYLTGKYATTTSSPAHALAAGLGWWATYEEDPDELVYATRAVGQNVGRKILAAFRALRDDKGRPLPLDGTLAVYPSVDRSVLDPTACDQAYPGVRDVLEGQVQVRYYGQGSIGDHLRRAGLLDGPFWLAAPTSWPGYNPADPNVCVVQEVGSSVPGTDRNHIITAPAALGAVWPAGSTYAQEDTLTLEEHNALMTLLNIAQTGRIDGDRKQWPYPYTPIAAVLSTVQHQHPLSAADVQAAVKAAMPTATDADAQAIADAVLAKLAAALAPAAGTAGSDVTKGAQ